MELSLVKENIKDERYNIKAKGQGQWTEVPSGVKEMLWLEYWDNYAGKPGVIVKEQSTWKWDMKMLKAVTRSRV